MSWFESGGGTSLKIVWVKRVKYNAQVNADDCDYMICSSSSENLGADVLRTVTGATLVEQKKLENEYDVAIYKDVSTNTVITQTRQYSETIAIGLKR